MALKVGKNKSAQATETNEAPASAEAGSVQETPKPAAAITEVKFDQPDKAVHKYLSTEDSIAGFVVEQNEDKRTWTAVDPNGVVLGKEYPSRAQAMQAVQDAANPGRSPKAKTNALTAREHTLLGALKENPTEPITFKPLSDKIEMSVADVMGMLGKLTRRKFVTLDGEGILITDAGLTAFDTYVAPPVKEKVKKEKVAKDPTIAAAKRQQAMEKKYGPRPEGIGARPTNLEYHTARLQVAEASLNMAKVSQRMHAYSPIAAKKITNAEERIALIKEEIAKIEAKGASGASAEVATDSTPENSED